jgi:hypothetical protein
VPAAVWTTSAATVNSPALACIGRKTRERSSQNLASAKSDAPGFPG